MTDDTTRESESEFAGGPAADLANAWTSFRSSGEAESSSACPDSRSLSALAQGLEVEDREGLLDHVLSCGGCRFELRATTEALRFAVDLEGSAQGSQGPGEMRPESSPIRRGLMLLAATVLVLLGLGVWRNVSDFTSVTEETVRSGTAVPEIGESVSPPSNAVLERFPESFSWPEVAGASNYRARLFSQSAEILWASSWSQAAQAEVPADVASEVGSAILYWEVDIQGEGELSPLGPFWFEVLASEDSR